MASHPTVQFKTPKRVGTIDSEGAGQTVSLIATSCRSATARRLAPPQKQPPTLRGRDVVRCRRIDQRRALDAPADTAHDVDIRVGGEVVVKPAELTLPGSGAAYTTFSGTWDMMYSDSAVMVRLGLTPRLAGTTDPSATNMLG